MSTLAEAVAKQDTITGIGWKSVDMILADAGSGKTAVIEMSADAQKLVINVRNSGGTQVSGDGSVTIDLDSLVSVVLAASATNVDATFRMLRWKDASTCVEYQATFLMTEPEAV